MNYGTKILVVEDNPDFLGVICTFLSSHFNQIRSAESGKLAAEIIHDWQPDIVLADFHLPDAKATELLHAHPDNTPGKFLIMTGDLRLREQLKTQKGIDRVLYKPFRLSDLLDVIGTGRTAET